MRVHFLFIASIIGAVVAAPTPLDNGAAVIARNSDLKRDAAGPDWRREAAGPDWRRKAGGPDWRREAGGPDWRREAGGPDWRREAQPEAAPPS